MCSVKKDLEYHYNTDKLDMRTRLYMKSFSEECLKTAASLHTTGSPSGVSWNRKSPAYFLSYTNKYITTIKTRDQYRTRFSADYKQVTRCNRFERKALLYDADKISSLFYFLIHWNCQSQTLLTETLATTTHLYIFHLVHKPVWEVLLLFRVDLQFVTTSS